MYIYIYIYTYTGLQEAAVGPQGPILRAGGEGPGRGLHHIKLYISNMM